MNLEDFSTGTIMGAVFGVVLVMISVILIIALINYIVNAVFLMQAAKDEGVKYIGFSWVPLINTIYLGLIGGKTNDKFKRTYTAVCIICYALIVFALIFSSIVLAIIAVIWAIVFLVYYIIALYKVYNLYISEGSAVALSIFSTLFSIVGIIAKIYMIVKKIGKMQKPIDVQYKEAGIEYENDTYEDKEQKIDNDIYDECKNQQDKEE